MTYIDYLNRFNRWAECNALPLYAVVLYYRFLDRFNRAGWPRNLRVDTLRLMLMAGCQKDAAYRARDLLAQAGFIRYEKGAKGRPTTYFLLEIPSFKPTETPTVSPTETPTVSPTETPTISPTQRKRSKNKTKTTSPSCPPGGGSEAPASAGFAGSASGTFASFADPVSSDSTSFSGSVSGNSTSSAGFSSGCSASFANPVSADPTSSCGSVSGGVTSSGGLVSGSPTAFAGSVSGASASSGGSGSGSSAGFAGSVSGSATRYSVSGSGESTGFADPVSVNSVSSGGSVFGSPTGFAGPASVDSASSGGPVPGSPGESFARFWQAYPRKAGKGAARKAWEKLRPGPELEAEILVAVERDKGTDQWRRDQGRFVPYPATWLNQSRWEDEPETTGDRLKLANYTYYEDDEEYL